MFVYLIKSKDNNLYKIGVAKNPSNRIKQLQTGSCEELIIVHTFETTIAFKVEKSIQRRYSHLHKINEWFNYDTTIEPNFLKECELINRSILLIEENQNIK